MGLKVGMGGEHHWYYKHTKFCQNLRGDPKFLVDLTRNDPYRQVPGIIQLFCARSLLPVLSNGIFEFEFIAQTAISTLVTTS